MSIRDFLSRLTGDKRRWWRYKARTRRLPDGYRMAVEALERYLMHFVPSDGDSAASMFEDLADLFGQAAADGTPIRMVVGEDPAEFAETFVDNYAEGGYVPSRARERLSQSIARAEAEEAP